MHCIVEAVLRRWTTVSIIDERRHTLPILDNILLRKKGDEVAFVADDIEVQITTHAAFGVGEEAAATTVGARKLLDILRALPESGTVRLGLDDGKLSVQSGRSRFALQTLAAADYPTVALAEQWEASRSEEHTS